MLLVVDLEATCSEDGSIGKHNRECIEIGAAKVDENFAVLDTFSEIVRPILNPELTSFCVGLTGITQEAVDTAETFDRVFLRFCEWAKTDSFSSWGDFDRKVFVSDCEVHGVPNPFRSHLDLSRRFTKVFGKRKGNRGAMKHLGLEPSGRHVLNIVKILPFLEL